MSESYIIGVRFDDARPTYCYYSLPLKAGQKVISEIDGTDYLGTVETCRQLRENEALNVYWPISRTATEQDQALYQDNLKRDIELIKIVQQEADKENLQMKVFRVSSSLDCQKVKIMYTSDDRVDFRNMLRILAPQIHARLEMRQVGPRDKAKMVGGLGICGLPLCCSTFLNGFEGISIAMAKNQMLAINIPKLSGQCGKLICCLKYEDEAYSEGKKEFPRLGTPIVYGGNTMKVSSFNVLARTVSLYSPDNMATISLDEYNAISTGKVYVPVKKASEAQLTPKDLGIVNPPSVKVSDVIPEKPLLTPVAPANTGDHSASSNYHDQGRKDDYHHDNHQQNGRPHNDYHGDEKWMYHGNNNKHHNNNHGNGNYHGYNNNNQHSNNNNQRPVGNNNPSSSGGNNGSHN
ncbi:MAG: stage 0 sporulation protein [Bacilli bacterium]|jgi:cell fate regulator YaaT (PSP1 superfamily)|nr:stage 0 sporulation protein [Bacilli bacterium]